MHREAGTFEEVPAHDVAMQSDSAIVLDHGTDVFIWTVSALNLCVCRQNTGVIDKVLIFKYVSQLSGKSTFSSLDFVSRMLLKFSFYPSESHCL